MALNSKPKAKRPAHRPSKLTEETLDKLMTYIRAGMSYTRACHKAGIDKSTFFRWKVQGESDTENGKRSDFRDFCDRLADASADLELSLTGAIKLCAIGTKGRAPDWRAAMSLLQARFPDDYKRAAVEITGPDGDPVQLHHRGRVALIAPDVIEDGETWAQSVQREASQRAMAGNPGNPSEVHKAGS